MLPLQEDRRIESSDLSTQWLMENAAWLREQRYRSYGNVDIEYHDTRTLRRSTPRRGYEVVTEGSNGQVKLIDFTPKWQPLDH